MGITGILSRSTVVSVLALLAAIPVTKVRAQSAAQDESGNHSTPKLKEPIARDIEVDKVWDGRGMAPFKSIDNPKMVKAASADFMVDDDYVLGVTVNGESRAYPTRFVWFHHAVNDTFGAHAGAGEKHVAITYCSVCNTGICYNAELNGKVVMFDFYGLYNGIVALCDRETEGVILQGEGRVIDGPLMGTVFKSMPLLDTTWRQWVMLHPDTQVMSPDTPFSRFYSPKDKPEPRGYSRFPAPYFQPTVTRGDLRLPPFDKVLAVTLPNEQSSDGGAMRRAYPVKSLAAAGGVVNETVGQTAVAVFYDSRTAAAVAVSPRVNKRTLTFELRAADGNFGIYDTQTGTRWSVEGVAEKGRLKGKTLDRLDCHLSQWYGWSAYFPTTTLYGSTEPPEPGDPFATSSTAH